jgi:hypothetical protein
MTLFMQNTMIPDGSPEQPKTIKVTAIWYLMFSRFIA